MQYGLTLIEGMLRDKSSGEKKNNVGILLTRSWCLQKIMTVGSTFSSVKKGDEHVWRGVKKYTETIVRLST